MHILHVQSMQVYATPSFDAVSPWQPAVDSWDLACVLCARDMVTEMDVALHAISVKRHVHHVRAKDEQRFRNGWTLSTPQDCEEQQACFSGNSQQHRCRPQPARRRR